jgi:type VI protein secretion system component Hcp
VPNEQFSMNYDKIKTEYFTTGSGGESDGWQSKAWSVAEEKEI